jgi:glutamate racemase
LLNTVVTQSDNKHADSNAPVGVFDSGIGGLSVVQHLREHLPNETFLYVADSGYAPYGERSNQELIDRSIKITDFFLNQGIKALVIACNTATAAAVSTLRQRYPDLIIIGMEPGIKPAAARSESKIVGILATRSTLQSEKFIHLSQQLSSATQTQFIPQPCVGLVNQIEKGDLHSSEILDLLRQYVPPLLDQGVDTLVLGCTHYPFVATQIQTIIQEYFENDHINQARQIHIIDTGEAVARRLHSLLHQHKVLADTIVHSQLTKLRAWTTGNVETLKLALAFSNLNQQDHPILFIDI